MIFAVAGVEYEDFRFEREEWPNHKPNMPFGQVPVLEIKEGDEVFQLAQSNAINRYLARKYNLTGKDDLESAKADMVISNLSTFYILNNLHLTFKIFIFQVVDQLNDLLNQISVVYYEPDEEKKQQLRAKLYETVIPQYIELFEKLLAKNNTQYFASDGLTYADLAIISALDRLGDKKEAILEKAPLIKAVDERVRNLSKVAEWLEKRPKTEM